MADVIWQTEEYRRLIQRRMESTNFYAPKVGVIDMYGNSPDSSLLFRGNGTDTTLVFGGQTLTAVFDESYQTVFDVRFVTTIGGTEYTIAGSSANAINYESMSVAGSTFSFGDFIGKIADMTFFDVAGDYDDVSFEGAHGVLSYGVQRTSGAYYWVSCGSFLVDDSKRTGITVWLSLTDYRSKFDGIHTGAIAANRTIFGIAQDACTSAGVTLGSVIGDLPNGATVVTNSATVLTTSPLITDIQLVNYIAQATGTFAIIGRDDKLYFKWYTNVSPVYSIDKRLISAGQTVADYTVTVTGTSWTDVNGTKYTNGTSAYRLDVSNNPFVVASYATLLTNIATNVVGFSYNPIEMKWVGDPCLDVGDIIVVPDKKGNVFSVPITSISCKKLLSQTMKSVGESHIANSSVKVSTTTQIETAKNEAIAFAKFQEIVADRITTGSLAADRIAAGSLTADKLAAGTITAASGVIGSIDASKITVGTLDASLITVTNMIAQKIMTVAGSGNYAEFGDLTGRGIGLDLLAGDVAFASICKTTNGFSLYDGAGEHVRISVLTDGSFHFRDNSAVLSLWLTTSNDAWIQNNCSALSFTDRTVGYNGDALSELATVATDKDGMINHSTLPEFARKKVKGIKTAKDSKGKPIIDKITGKIETEEFEEDGRDLGAMISILTVAVQQLKTITEKQQNQIDKPIKKA